MQKFCSVQVFLALCLLLGQSLLLRAAEAPPPETNETDQEENRTDTDEAEFRQGGIAQQLMSAAAGYNPMGGLYGAGGGASAGSGAYQYGASGNAAGGSGYVNMLRNLYRPPSLGLTDKVKHWVKSFMNRRQYVKPYYNPSAVANLQYSADEFGAKPVFVGANGYKAISVPLRQLQKYYKPYYATSADSGFQSQPGSAAASGSILSYSPAGFYTAGGDGATGQFGGTGSGLYGGSSSDAALFAAANGGSSSGSGNPFSSGGTAGLFSQGSSPNYFSANEGVGSALFSASGLYGGSGSSNGGLYQASSNQGASFSLDGSYGSESGGSAYSFGSGNRGTSHLSSSSGPGAYAGDLYASGASPAATVYNPEQGGRYGSKKHHHSGGGSSSGSYGSSGSALYMSSSDQRSNVADPSYASKDSVLNSFNVDSARGVGGSPPESQHSYSVSFQPSASAQGKSYGSGFQPVSFGAESGFQAKSDTTS